MMKTTSWISIDVGILHLALVCGQVNSNYQLIKITNMFLIDITRLTHRRVKENECKLHHTRDILDRVDHCIQELEPLFNEAQGIVIERQPLNGLVVVEKLFYQRFREKTLLVHPTSMHRFFGMKKGTTYEQRKLVTEEKCLSYLTPSQQKDLSVLERKHDIADAICFLAYILHQLQVAHKEKVDQNPRRSSKTRKKPEEKIQSPPYKTSPYFEPIMTSLSTYFDDRSEKDIITKEIYSKELNSPLENLKQQLLSGGTFSLSLYFQDG